MRTLFRSMIASGALVLSGVTVASAAPQKPNLQVLLQAPASVAISTPTVYTVVVNNIGNAHAQNVQLVVDFPLTNTSPTVKILGTVSGVTSPCQVASNKMTCGLGEIRKGRGVTVTYTYAAPVSTKSLLMKATGTTANDSNLSNNIASLTPNLTYPARAITSATMNNSHCTGQNLTSYFECLLYPSSIASHVTTFDVGGTIGFSEPGYTGTWSQNAAKTSLFFEYFEGADKIAEFNGYAINGSNCFDGLTNFFPQPSAYVSPYRVCIQ